MIQTLIDTICRQLKDVFSDYEIYTESVQQGIEMPCFFVACVSFTKEKYLGERYKYSTIFSIQFLADSNYKEDIYTVADQLPDVLEYLPMDDGPMRGTGPGQHLEDGALTYTISYDFYSYDADEYEEKFKDYGMEIKVMR